MRLRALSLLLVVLWTGAALAADSSASLSAKRAQATKQQAELRADIEQLRKKIHNQEASQRDAADQLKASESAISTISRQLVELNSDKQQTEQELDKLGKSITHQKGQLTLRQSELADQLRAQYASGLSPWTALLSGDDPQAIGRDLSYFGYISRAQTQAIRAVRDAIDELARLQDKSKARHERLDQLAHETSVQKEALEQQQQERRKVLAKIESQLNKQHAQAQHLKQNDQRLGKLIDGLESAIARQAEAARRAQAARKAEAARRTAAARKAEEARHAQELREAQAARNAQAVRNARQAREQVEQAREQARRAEQAEQPAQPAQARGRANEPRLAPAGGFSGLTKGLPPPVAGATVQGRFGMERPDGGLWRGIVLRANQGTPVHVIAAGRVVFADWLSGFGNIMIVDHGAKYLSVYAYNQSLLKQVGDIVQAGETIATVGATGGQVEPGLYFEIRHHGKPVNPLLWLGH